MQKGHVLEFHCQSCQHPVQFSVFSLDKDNHCIGCQSCQKKYLFNDETLLRQLRKFEGLCRQLIESEEILSQTSVGVDLGSHHVKVPYKLLLTRLNSSLELIIGSEPTTITFRIEPLSDAVNILT